MSQLREKGRIKRDKFFLPPPFCFIQALNGLDDANPHWGGQSTESTVQMLILS